MWTLDELVDRVRAALADAEYTGAPNGRVREVPDRRAIRWYTTTGLVDRPVAMRGRVALYGRRHLLQLVAVKRRQADGRSLAEIQAELAGATDATLAAIARVPEDLDSDLDAEPAPARPRFWAAAPAALTQTLAGPVADIAAGGPLDDPPMRSPLADSPPGGPSDGLAERPDDVLAGVPLGGGAVLLLPAHPEPDDLPAIRAAARPLLDLLAGRRLLEPGHPYPRAGHPWLADPGPAHTETVRGPRTHRSPS